MQEAGTSYLSEASTAWLRHLLLKGGTERGDLISYGTHSLKATVLTWLAKRGIPRDVRAALGYHAKAVDGTEVVYGRQHGGTLENHDWRYL